MAKTRTSVSIDEDLLKDARSCGLGSLSMLFENLLREEVRKAKAERWKQENQEAIEEYNRRIEKEGTLAEKYGAWHGQSV